MPSMKIAAAGSEVAGLARTGGLGDVLEALPRQLAARGHQVRLFVPLYGIIDPERLKLERFHDGVPVQVGDRQLPMTLYRHIDRKSRLEIILVGNDELFDRPHLYRDPETGDDFHDNDVRFFFFCRGVLEALRTLNWAPDILHAHDWQAALLPVLLKWIYNYEPLFGKTRSVLTIHNLGYQGVFEPERFTRLGLPPEMFYAMSGPLEFYGKMNLLKAGIVTADKLTTVSETYAREIQQEAYGYGLDGVLRQRAGDLVGILNGVDYTTWSPSRDKYIPYRYHTANLSGKRMTRVELLNEASLPQRETAPLIGMVSRLADQKGFDLLQAAADRLLARDVQLIILGVGDSDHHEFLEKLEQSYPDKVKVYLTFNDELAHKIEAAADMFLMPSLYEPCGLNQMYSLKYGTVPIVRRVGGLADTVIDYDPETTEGTGFVFDEYSADAMLEAVERALVLYQKRRAWTKVMKAGMKQDFSWKRSADKYEKLFSSLTTD